MQTPGGFWRWYGAPVLLSLATFYVMNLVWNLPGPSDFVGHVIPNAVVPNTVAVYLAGGSGLAMALLLRAARAGRLSRGELGLDPAGWSPMRRLGGVAVIVLLAYGGWVGTAGPDGRRPTWDEFCFLFAVVMSASLAELLVFLGVGFCLFRRGLRAAGVRPLWALLIAAGAGCVAFGLYHYTYEPRWWPYVFPLMAEMALVVLFFLGSRNFFLTFVFHNVMATLGFLGEQYSPNPQDLTYYSERGALTANLASFLIPFVLLHALEWKGWPPAPPAPDGRPIA